MEKRNHKLDSELTVFFYEQDFYVLSNFSSFRLMWSDIDFDTSEHAYQWSKFQRGPGEFSAETTMAADDIADQIRRARSAHEAFKIAESGKPFRRVDWDLVKVGVMYKILLAKTEQHEYVHRKLLETGNRELIEDSWRDDFWGWGERRDGRNMLGKLWMEVRKNLRAGVVVR